MISNTFTAIIEIFCFDHTGNRHGASVEGSGVVSAAIIRRRRRTGRSTAINKLIICFKCTGVVRIGSDNTFPSSAGLAPDQVACVNTAQNDFSIRQFIPLECFIKADAAAFCCQRIRLISGADIQPVISLQSNHIRFNAGRNAFHDKFIALAAGVVIQRRL